MVSSHLVYQFFLSISIDDRYPYCLTENCNTMLRADPLVLCSKQAHFKFSSFPHTSPIPRSHSALRSRNTVKRYRLAYTEHSSVHWVLQVALCQINVKIFCQILSKYPYRLNRNRRFGWSVAPMLIEMRIYYSRWRVIERTQSDKVEKYEWPLVI